MVEVRLRRHDDPAVRTPPPPLQPVERPATSTMEDGGKSDGLEARRCRHVQISQLFSLEECKQSVMDFLAATEVGNFLRR